MTVDHCFSIKKHIKEIKFSMINIEIDGRKIMFINSKNQVGFLPAFKRVSYKTQWLHYSNCIPRKRNFKKEDTFFTITVKSCLK